MPCERAEGENLRMPNLIGNPGRVGVGRGPAQGIGGSGLETRRVRKHESCLPNALLPWLEPRTRLGRRGHTPRTGLK